MNLDEEKAFKLSQFGSLIVIGLGIVILILSISIFIVGEYGFGPLQRFQIVVIIIFSIILPAVIFIFSFSRLRAFFKSKIPKDSLILGIIILAIAAFLIAYSIYWINYVGYFIGAPDVSGLAVGILICIIAGIVALALCVFGSVSNILNYLKSK
jgi:hypothetical protein